MTTEPASLETLAATGMLLVALDFDGTVSPLVDDPKDSRIVPVAAEGIARLKALADTRVAFVSGRPLDALRPVAHADATDPLVGSHGVEVSLDGRTLPVDLSADELGRLEHLGPALAAVVERVPGARLERKPVGFGVHSRKVDGDLVDGLQDEARAAAAAVGGFHERAGKDILEFAVRDVDKGDGIDRLRRELGATAVLYAGDDVTDEDAFRALGPTDLGVKVGAGETAATTRVADPDAVGELLMQLATLREASAARY